jgi:hypothetical protein
MMAPGSLYTADRVFELSSSATACATARMLATLKQQKGTSKITLMGLRLDLLQGVGLPDVLNILWTIGAARMAKWTALDLTRCVYLALEKNLLMESEAGFKITFEPGQPARYEQLVMV